MTRVDPGDCPARKASRQRTSPATTSAAERQGGGPNAAKRRAVSMTKSRSAAVPSRMAIKLFFRCRCRRRRIAVVDRVRDEPATARVLLQHDDVLADVVQHR